MTTINSSSNNQDDDFWVENIRNGDGRAFEILFKKYYLPLTRFVWRYVNSKAIAEELIQELFTILWEKREDWDMDTEKSIRAYLYKSARNLALNQIKHQEIKEKLLTFLNNLIRYSVTLKWNQKNIVQKTIFINK